MSKKKLSGLKVIREHFNITPDQLAAKLMLLNDVNIQRVIRGQDILDMESKSIVDSEDIILRGLECIFNLPKECYIDKTLAEATLNNLKKVDIKRNTSKSKSNIHKTVTGLTIRGSSVNGEQFYKTIYLPLDISQNVINHVYDEYINNRGPVKDEQEFIDLMEQIKQELFKYSQESMEEFYENFDISKYDTRSLDRDTLVNDFSSKEAITTYIEHANFVYNAILDYGITDYKKLSVIFPYICDKYIDEIIDDDSTDNLDDI